ncbi:MAG: DMT family transporter [Candidatus Omnitrophica bacterium]|nr:DMT family transporter [Candidatus Omnitrophota bacterium]
MGILHLIIFTICLGFLMPIQSGINGQLGLVIKQPMLATTISMGGGFIASVLIYILMGNQLPPPDVFRKIPWYLYTGGLCGVIFVTSILILVPKYGIAKLGAGVIVGQLLFALLLDHFGWMGMPTYSLSYTRLFGVLFLFAGLFLIHR